MAEWFLIWILTVETYSGEVKDRYPMSVTMNSLEECEVEAKEKLLELERQLGQYTYTTMTFGGQVSLGGKLVGVKVGCQQREKAPSYQAPIK